MISGARTRVAVGQNGFPISVRTSPANAHDSAKSADVMEDISEFMDDDGTIKQIASVYADREGYGSTAIGSCLKNRNPIARIPLGKNGKSSKRTNRTRNMIRFDALRRDYSLAGSKTDFTGQESDVKGDVRTVLRLLVLRHF